MNFRKKSKIFLIIFLTIIILESTNTGVIIPDQQNPILIKDPNTSNTPFITVRFSLDPNGSGISSYQVIGLEFAKFMSGELNFASILRYSCTLYFGDKQITVKALKPESANESNIAYCQITDPIYTILNPVEKLTLKFTMIAPLRFSTGWIRGVKLFTATSTNVDKIYIDSSAHLGSVGLYGDPLGYSASNPIISMTLPQMMINDERVNSVYPEDKFDVVLNINSSIFLNKNDFILTFKFDSTVVKAPLTVHSSSIPATGKDAYLFDKLKGDLKINLSSDKNMIIIDNIDEDFVTQRKFILTLKDFEALGLKTNVFIPLEMKIYYRNTYSLLMTQVTESSSNIFKINPKSISMRVNHPDLFDIFRNGIFPFKFKFEIESKIDIPINILIQHTNAKKNQNSFSFVAATCDFSENDSSFPSSFGERPICRPLRTDFNYLEKHETEEYKANGIFFSFKKMEANKPYYLTVWGSADNCGGDRPEAFKTTIEDVMGLTKVKYNFSMTAYNGINENEMNEKRLNTRPIIALTQNNVEMGNICWNTVMNLNSKFPFTYWSNIFSPSNIPFFVDNYKTFITTIDSAGTDCDSGYKVRNSAVCSIYTDISLYREFTNIKLLNVVNLKPSGNYLGDLSQTLTNESYLYSAASAVSSNSYFALTFEFLADPKRFIFELIPSPIAYDIGTVDNIPRGYFRVQPGRLEFKFQKKWFTAGNPKTDKSPGCYIGWGINDSNIPYSNIVMRNFEVPANTNDCATITKNGQNNFLTSYTNKRNLFGIDCENSIENLDLVNSILPLGNNSDLSKDNYRIISIWNSSGPGIATPDIYGIYSTGSYKTDKNSSFNWPIEINNMNKEMDNEPNKVFGIFSSCLKFNSAPNIKSLYESFDIQINYLFHLKTGEDEKEKEKEKDLVKGVPHRAIRIIKMFPEGGVFQDVTSGRKKVISELGKNYPNVTTEGGVNRSYKLHYALGLNNISVGICLIEINGMGLGATLDDKSNVLGIWIGLGVLLENDYEDVSSVYPIVPFANKLMKAYAHQSGYFMDTESNFYHNKLFKCNNELEKTTSFLHYNMHLYGGTGCLGKTTYTNQVFKDKIIQNYRSSYIFLMGSLIMIYGISEEKITTNSNADNLLIPIYCPIHDDQKGIKHLNGIPTLYMAYLSMNEYKIISLNRIFSQKVGTNEFTTVITSVGNDPFSFRPEHIPAQVNNDPISYRNFLFNLRWADYSNTQKDSDSILYLYYGSINNNGRFFFPNSNSSCTGYILLFNESIVVEKEKLRSTLLNNAVPQYYNNNEKFYYLGKSFNHIIMMGIGNVLVGNDNFQKREYGSIVQTTKGELKSLTPMEKTSELYIVGIKRPSINSYWDKTLNSFKSPFDSVGFFCSSFSSHSKELFTNYLSENIIKITGTFIVDFNPLALTSRDDPKVSVTFDKDNPSNIYFSDGASSIRIMIKLPYFIPAGSTIKFSAINATINKNTICGLSQGETKAAIECENSLNTISCLTNLSDNSYNICCYNLNSLTRELITVNNLKIKVPSTPLPNLSFISEDIYTIAEEFKSTYSIKTEEKIETSAKIQSINYSHLLQENGIGKIIIKINLPRDPQRNMKITVEGDFVSHKLANINPRCYVTFGNKLGENWDTGDIILDKCDISGIQAVKNPIIITTKSIIYKCGISFSSGSTLSVMIWPVKIANWNTLPYKENKYLVKMQLNTEEQIDIAVNNFSHKVISSPLEFLNKPLLEENKNLCNVSNVTPLLPGELAQWIFDFDLDYLKEKYQNSSPNEITIFFDYNIFGGINEMIICKYENAIIPCYFSDEGIFNIKFNSILKIGSGKIISLYLQNMINPTYDSDIIFSCTVNNNNGNTRTNIITGQGRLIGGIKLNSKSEGGLRFVNKIISSNENPRISSTHNFKITFDEAIGLVALPKTIENYPKIILSFPKEYKLGNFPNLIISCKLYEYIGSSLTNLITKSASLDVKECYVTGNFITVILFQAKYSFNTSFKYWDLEITNVKNPLDTTISKESNTTGQFSVVLTNENYSANYRSYNNLNSCATNPMKSSIDTFIGFDRGLQFKFDNTKWIIDFMDELKRNIINIRPGRFSKIDILIRNIEENIPLIVAKISLTDNIFKFSQNEYLLSPIINKPVPAYIGAPCKTIHGRYLINFTLTTENSDIYAPLFPILAIVDQNVPKAEISMIFSSDTIPLESKLLIKYNISEPNFDELNISFRPVKDYENDPNSFLSGTIIPPSKIEVGELFDSNNIPNVQPNLINYSMFSITSKNKLEQKFTANEINKCYTWVKEEIIIKFSGEIPSLGKTDFKNSFNYIFSGNDKPIEKNALKFSFNPTIVPIFLYCALVCNDRNYPNDQEIIKQETPPNNLVQYYIEQYTNKLEKFIFFKKLVRNTKYKIRCIVKSVHSNEEDSEKIIFNYEKYNNIPFYNTTSASNNINNEYDLATEKHSDKKCLQFIFNENPNLQQKKNFVDFCQKLFNKDDWKNNGCVICSDSAGKILSPGFSFPTGMECKEDKISSMRIIQEIKNNSTSNTQEDANKTINSNSTNNTQEDVNMTINSSSTNNIQENSIELINPNSNSYDSKNKQYAFTVCANFHPTCPSNVNVLEVLDSNYDKVMSEFFRRINNMTLLNSIGITQSQFNSSILFTDDKIPDISKVEFYNEYATGNGRVLWYAFSEIPMTCSWKIFESQTEITVNDVLDCKETDWCGKDYRIGPYITYLSTDDNKLKPFVAGLTYSLNFVCTKDVYRPAYFSQLKNISLSIPNKPVQQKKEENIQTNSTFDPNGSDYLNFNNYMIIQLLFFILLSLF